MRSNVLVKGLYLSGCLLLSSYGKNYAQDITIPADTIRLNVQQIQDVFLSKNLQLLAKHFDVQADSALIKQARLWDNPNLNTDQNVYSHNGFFRHGGDDGSGNTLGQYYIQVEQLIRTAGKRGKQIRLAATNAQITQWQFYDLMRNLKLQLRSDFYTVIQLQSNDQLYKRQTVQLDKLLMGMNAQYQAGNVARKDVLRVEALRLNTDLEMAQNARKLSDVQSELRNLLQLSDDVYVLPVENKDEPLLSLPAANLEQLINDGRKTNSTYQLQQFQAVYQQQNLAYQKALAVPDVNLGPNFDRSSNYVTNYVGLSIGFALPVFNRNQGNIKSARYQVQQAQTTLQQADLELQNNIRNAYRKLQISVALGSAKQREFYTNYTQLYNNVVESYNARQISLLEFIDYFNDYEDIREKQLQQELDVRLAKEELNYQVGANVFQ